MPRHIAESPFNHPPDYVPEESYPSPGRALDAAQMPAEWGHKKPGTKSNPEPFSQHEILDRALVMVGELTLRLAQRDARIRELEAEGREMIETMRLMLGQLNDETRLALDNLNASFATQLLGG